MHVLGEVGRDVGRVGHLRDDAGVDEVGREVVERQGADGDLETLLERRAVGQRRHDELLDAADLRDARLEGAGLVGDDELGEGDEEDEGGPEEQRLDGEGSMSSGAVESEKNGSALRTVVGSRDFARFEPRRDGERGRADDGRGPGELVHLEGGDGGGERPPDVETDGRIAREALERLHRAEGERRRLPHEAQDERLDLRLDRERQPFGVPGEGLYVATRAVMTSASVAKCGNVMNRTLAVLCHVALKSAMKRSDLNERLTNSPTSLNVGSPSRQKTSGRAP